MDACAEDISVIRRCRSLSHCFKVSLKSLSLSIFEGYDVVIPMEEAYATWLSRHRSDIGDKAAVPGWETFSLASDKTRLMAFCEAHGFPHPRTRNSRRA